MIVFWEKGRIFRWYERRIT